jgi:RNA polymerase sigma factor (sigma-70 family)
MQESQAHADLLLPRIARGEAPAVEACIERYTPLVWTLARRMTRDVGVIEELVQEIFVEIWRSASRFDPVVASESTFIAMIARRRIIDRQRRAARSSTVELPDELDLVAEPEPDLARIDDRDESQRAARALEQIKPEQRRLILMAVVDGLTHQEIATTTGLPLGTVKSHIRRGLDRTAQILRAPRKEPLP